ncbi:capsular polysaccharide biosynthesis protein [Schauerella aestuarii]|uniref:capsular polysaccharide biosynthesis protein n=1 Tax=Schauerella aestuarii TaxID=2511204 RepID=UPI001367A883|nr:capsular polysaccharide biosynthesis protein [Achromobacter aestuarii]MYZ45494.1 capsular polysaccharide biosynthesis protein [Achromobacter aestuarii]
MSHINSSEPLTRVKCSPSIYGRKIKFPNLLCFSKSLVRHSTIRVLLEEFEFFFDKRLAVQSEFVVVWGRKPNALKSIEDAGSLNLPVLSIEDGFLRSLGLGHQDPPSSIIIDDVGIYFDSRHPSRLEQLISRELSVKEFERARMLRKSWRDNRVSKYNSATVRSAIEQDYVLVVDQTEGDASIAGGQADHRTFERMLLAALCDNSDVLVVVKVHPDVLAGRKRGHFDLSNLSRNGRIVIIAVNVCIADLVANARAVYVVTSQVGFEALIWGRPVITFGVPFYAGWGLTVDRGPPTPRRCVASIEQLLHAALVDYSRYADPESGRRCEVEHLVEWVGVQIANRARFDGRAYAVGFSKWKHSTLRHFFAGVNISFFNSEKKLIGQRSRCDHLIVWGCRHEELVKKFCGNQTNSRVTRVEDGFLRSVGLGADFIKPLSWVLDDKGIHYDARTPSGLEADLNNRDYTEADLYRAGRLIHRIVEHRITKYNLIQSCTWTRPSAKRRVILVPGQVENDASIQFGSSGITSNLELLKAVRRDSPDAYVIYKQHPDVVAGLRAAGPTETEVSHYCDEIIYDVSIANLFEQIDEVCVLTSLSGFEALLRGKSVTTYGQPFYSGWGLTVDRALTPEVIARRRRRLSLEQLVFSSLIAYPTYISRVTHLYTTPERALDELEAWGVKNNRRSPLRRLIARILNRL